MPVTISFNGLHHEYEGYAKFAQANWLDRDKPNGLSQLSYVSV